MAKKEDDKKKAGKAKMREHLGKALAGKAATVNKNHERYAENLGKNAAKSAMGGHAAGHLAKALTKKYPLKKNKAEYE